MQISTYILVNLLNVSVFVKIFKMWCKLLKFVLVPILKFSAYPNLSHIYISS